MNFIKTFVAALALTASAAHAAPVLTNGDFENGLTGWTTSGNVGLAPKFGGGFYFGAGTPAQDGTWAVAFNLGNTAPNAVLSQAFGTIAGNRYRVSFDFGATNCAFSCQQSIDVSAAGTNFNATGYSAGPLQHFTFDFTAQGSLTTLAFADVATNDSFNLDGVLDNVSVSNVPEPGSIALIGLGLAGVALRRRRRA